MSGMSVGTSSTDVDVAAHVAASAAATLVDVRRGFEGDDLADLKDLGDASAQACIAALLIELRSEDAVLSEEAKDSPDRLNAERVWIIDPLDGTREYSEGRDDWAVHVALWQSGDLVAAAVALGGPELILTTSSVTPVGTASDARLRVAVSRSRPPAIVTSVADQLGAELVAMGSAGVKVCSVVKGDTDAYVHGGGQYEWDSAAPVAVARAAGLHTSRLDGSPLIYNQSDPYLPDLVVCRPEIAADLLRAISKADA